MGSTAILNPVHLHAVVFIEIISHHCNMLSGRLLHKLKTDDSFVLDSGLGVQIQGNLSGQGVLKLRNQTYSP